jgi:quinol monooxygenase YgiN
MAVAVIVQGGSRGDYKRVAERINAEGVPEGAILHTATDTPDGVRMFDVWESREAFERFMEDKIAPLAEELDIEMTGPPPEIHELFTVILNQEARV